MTSLLCLLGISLALSLMLTPWARGWAAQIGLVDAPDGRRKIHVAPIPVAGGLCLLIVGSCVLGAALLLPHALQDHLQAQRQFLAGLFLSGLTICLVGIVDDHCRLRARHKLLGQAAAVSIMMSFGVLVDSIQLFGWRLELGPCSIPFTAFLLLGAINSLNLIDGMDGLLSSVGVILSLALAALAALAGQWTAAAVAMTLGGALLGFLRYNFPPASIFLGDSGSMLVGLVLGTLVIQSSLKAPATIAVAMPLALLTLPIFDTTAAIVRRKLTGRSIYATDRGHLHHCLLRHGLSTRRVLLLVSVLCLITCGGVLASQAFNHEWFALVTAFAVIALLIVTRLFGYAEAVLVKERLLSLLSSAKRVRQMEVRLQGSAAWQELWVVLTHQAGDLNLQRMLLDVNAPALYEGYHARWDRLPAEIDHPSLWRAEIPLTAKGATVGRLEIAGLPDTQPLWMKIAAVTHLVEEFSNPLTGLFCGCFEPAVAQAVETTGASVFAEEPTQVIPAPHFPLQTLPSECP
jgi:UDP-GlcNAc:undecaprenyl-phosphate GlcNAc-1-phosphate transferase